MYFQNKLKHTPKTLLAICFFISTTFAYAAPLKVVASFSIVADLVQAVGGADAEVSTLIQHNSDAHMFDPSAMDARALSQAQLFFINGLDFEPWAERLKKSAGFKGTQVIVSQGIMPLSINHDAHDHDHDKHQHSEYDPHAWQDVSNTIIYVQNIQRALSLADPANTLQYEARAKAYIQELKTLDQNIRTAVAALPENHRVLITTHDSFGYFAHAYGFITITPMGISTEAQPSAADIAKLIQQIRALKVPALFLENTSNSKIIAQIAKETNTTLGGNLYTDALTEKGTPTDNYIGMMRKNIDTLIKALSAPP